MLLFFCYLADGMVGMFVAVIFFVDLDHLLLISSLVVVGVATATAGMPKELWYGHLFTELLNLRNGNLK